MAWTETFFEFKERQACEYVKTERGFLFRNGATSNGQERHSEPPADIFIRLGLQREFLLTQLKQHETVFRQYKDDVLNQAKLATQYSNLPGPPTDAAEVLGKLKTDIEAIRVQIGKIDRRLAESQRAKEMDEKQRYEQERQRNVSAVAVAVSQIEI